MGISIAFLFLFVKLSRGIFKFFENFEYLLIPVGMISVNFFGRFFKDLLKL